jgi:hypothetical protein
MHIVSAMLARKGRHGMEGPDKFLQIESSQQVSVTIVGGDKVNILLRS